MDEIRLLKPSEINDYLDIVANAFPMIKMETPEEKEKFRRQILKSIEIGLSAGAYGCFKENQLAGGMRFMDYTMNMFQRQIRMGGLSLVAVHLAHKKEKVCSQMVQYFLNHYYDQGAFLVGLYPFRPDFYKKMGFGFGTKTKQYRISPAKLAGGSSKGSIGLLKADDTPLIVDYHRQLMERRHGFIKLTEYEVKQFFEDHKKIAGYFKKGRLEGYLTFSFEPDPRGKYRIHVTGLFYNRREVLAELLCFLSSQADQMEQIIVDTHEEYFHFVADNPANGDQAIFLHHQTNVEELGIMYRVINNRLLFESLKEHDFGGVTLSLGLNVHDSFFPKNNERLLIHFENGKPRLMESGESQVEVTMDVSEFSSLVMGVVPFGQLYQYSRAEISNQEFVPMVERLFFTGEKPVCYTRF
jgi:predicted acetyltransferase